MIFQSFKMALKAIAGNKMRSFLTILGVVIGVLAIVVLVSIGQGANSSVTASIEGMGTNLISATINARRTNPVTADGLNELAENEAIAYIAPLTNVSGTVKAGVNTYDDGTVQGTAPGYEHIRNWAVAEGRFLTQPDIDNRSFVAVIGAEAASEMYGTTHAVGETFTLSGYTMTVIGVLATNGESASGSNDNQILIPYPLAQRLSNSTGISSFYVSAASSDQVTQAQTAVEAYLEKSFEGYNTRSFGTQYSVYNQTEMLSTLSDTTATLSLMLGGIAGISLLVGVVATGVSLVIGVAYGLVSGYAGGRLDALMMRLVDVLFALPFIVLVIIFSLSVEEPARRLTQWVSGMTGWSVEMVSPMTGLIPLFIAIGALGWLTLARIVRTQTMELKGQEFVEAARSLGIGHMKILFRHIAPNLFGAVIVYTTLAVPGIMLLEAVLSFLGLGVKAPNSSWGTLIKEGADRMEVSPELLLFPALLFSATLLALNFLGDGLRDALDPKSSRD